MNLVPIYNEGGIRSTKRDSDATFILKSLIPETKLG